jgi:hypothetical protein
VQEVLRLRQGVVDLKLVPPGTWGHSGYTNTIYSTNLKFKCYGELEFVEHQMVLALNSSGQERV